MGKIYTGRDETDVVKQGEEIWGRREERTSRVEIQDSSSRTAGVVVREDAGSKETALAGKGDGGVRRRCSGYGQGVWSRVSDAGTAAATGIPRCGRGCRRKAAGASGHSRVRARGSGVGREERPWCGSGVGRRGGRVIAKWSRREGGRDYGRERDATVGWMGEGRACRHGGRGRGGMGWAWQHGEEGAKAVWRRRNGVGEDAAAGGTGGWQRTGGGAAAVWTQGSTDASGGADRGRAGDGRAMCACSGRRESSTGMTWGVRRWGKGGIWDRDSGYAGGGGSGYVVVEGVREGQEWRLRSMRGGSVGTVVPWRVRRGTGRGAGRGRWWSRWAGHGGRTSRRGRAGSARRGLGSGTGRQYGKRSTQCGRSSWRESGVEGGRRKARGLGSGVGTGWDTRAESRQQRGGTGGAWQRGRGWERRGGDRRGPAPRTLDARSGVMQLRRGGRRGRRGRHGGRHWERLLGATAVAMNVRLGGTKKVQPHEVEVARGNRGAAESPRDTSRRCRARTQGFRGAGEHDKRRWPSIRAQYTEGVQLKQWNLRYSWRGRTQAFSRLKMPLCTPGGISGGRQSSPELEPATKETNETSSSAEARAGVTRNVPERTGFEAQSTQHNREGVGIGLQPARAVKRSMKTGRSTYLRTEPSTPSNCPNAESWGASWLLGQRSDTLSTVLEDIPFQRALLGSAAAKSTQAGSQGYAEDQLQREKWGGSLSFGRRRRGGGLNHAVETGERGGEEGWAGGGSFKAVVRDDVWKSRMSWLAVRKEWMHPGRRYPKRNTEGTRSTSGKAPAIGVKSAGSPGPREKDLGQSAGDGARRARTRPTWATMERVVEGVGEDVG
ncbi:hypothetical protein B0H14DRAFT_2601588 [Mycena olivaceomarginata]|nr:hypothetical protein B0H14DRAFT_2601588 [Mycena olivaceomarginata]